MGTGGLVVSCPRGGGALVVLWWGSLEELYKGDEYIHTILYLIIPYLGPIAYRPVGS